MKDLLKEMHDIVRDCESTQYKLERMIDLKASDVFDEFMTRSKHIRNNYELLKSKINEARFNE